MGEQVRRLALGLFAALMTARAYWPSEVDPSQASGSGLLWTLAMHGGRGALDCLGLSWAAGSGFAGRGPTPRVVALVFLVGLSSTHGLDRRLAINLAWEWAGLGFAYILARNLPRTRGESTVLAGALVATAVAVSAYGLSRRGSRCPHLKQRFRKQSRSRSCWRRRVPQDPQRVRAFADRLLGSNEVFSTFGLANSLAGFLVGPLVLVLAMVIRNLADRSAPGSRWGVIGLAAPSPALFVDMFDSDQEPQCVDRAFPSRWPSSPGKSDGECRRGCCLALAWRVWLLCSRSWLLGWLPGGWIARCSLNQSYRCVTGGSTGREPGA